jgi:hypothetical protein
MEDDLKQICKWKMTSRQPHKNSYLVEDLNYFFKWKTTYIGLEMEDNLKKNVISIQPQ